MILNVKEYVTQKKESLKERIKELGYNPSLLIIQVGDNPASNSYIKGKIKDCEEVGIDVHLIKEEAKWFREEGVFDYNNFSYMISNADGVILQLPVEDKNLEHMIINSIRLYQDVDGFQLGSPFKPCTPAGIIDYLENGLHENLAGKVITVVGKGPLVGGPIVPMLMEKGATVISCNSKTKELGKMIYMADIVISAVGKANLIGDLTETKVGQIIIDAGTTRDEDGKLCGDVDKRIYDCPYLQVTPVPGGVGLLTRLQLLDNVVTAAEWKGKQV
jgi:methylenetetrahydrofolate dehydrogenase (NADP+)/methenyltetrahydrofolate cyclohydrolase